jgi:hypothetical protein
MRRFFAIALLAAAAVAQAAQPTTPSVLNGLTQDQQSYQIGVWCFLILLFVSVLGFGTVATIDYSEDTLLLVDTSATKSQ